MKSEPILILAAEGGRLTLSRTRIVAGWRFYVERNESALDLHEEDADLIPLLVHTQVYDSFSGAVEALPAYWRNLYPQFIHPLYAVDILNDVSKHGCNRTLEEWMPIAIENNPIYETARILASAKKLVVLTGAGMSVESGVPDFRSPTGWWRKLDPVPWPPLKLLIATMICFMRFIQLGF